MTAPRPTRPDADRDASHPPWVGRAAFGLAVVSTIVYFAASEGIRNFAAFVVDGLGRVAKLIGVGG